MRRTLSLLLPAVLLLLWQGSALASGDGGHAEAHGTPWDKIGFHALNFVIFVSAALYFARGMVRDALRDRATAIRVDIEQSQEAREAAQRSFEALQKRISGLEAQLSTMRQQAEEEARQEAILIAERADRDVAMIQEAAERSIRNETERARGLLRREAVEIAIDLAAQQLKSRVGAAENAQLTGQLIAAVQAPQTGENHHV